MAISRYREPTSFFGLQRLNRILDEAVAGLPFAEQGNVITSTWFAPTDVSEDANSLRITMELPGVDPNDVRLSLENNVLTIRGEKKQNSEENNERIHRFERTYGMFERTFVLPNTVDTERIEARHENGVLFRDHSQGRARQTTGDSGYFFGRRVVPDPYRVAIAASEQRQCPAYGQYGS